ncbi:uncharacterized protein N7496_009961 [Penicillium cataractarum]|uniref:Xylanolytic transcriptional activator regulatory domain-containing protein n=1 Tax=Penicillium cataractarum TaxID=2100454 RepID=A0A9W9RPY5_9EURO|nr:uncharacterized protein N7496_009961 [Penicillium cataractarum]KAJ5364248.1 hypothetical protein N7496_009961 [Penicillium cataractarum]
MSHYGSNDSIGAAVRSTAKATVAQRAPPNLERLSILSVKKGEMRRRSTRCQGKDEICLYNKETLAVGRRTKGKAAVARTAPNRRPSNEDEPASLQQQLDDSELEPPLGSKHVGEEEDVALDPNQTYYTPHCRFDGKVKEVVAANDQKAGLAPPAVSNLVPFVDAPLFGELDLDSRIRSQDFVAQLPVRSRANELVSFYWWRVDTIEPILDRKRFFHDYEASWVRSWDILLADHEIWLSILNVVFALAVQRQELIPVRERNAEANLYFQRAWMLLRPEKFLWEPGSVQLVQCLMLINRYLHCTSHQQKTWMTGGLALRISQNMNCQPPDVSSSPDSNSEREKRQKVWVSSLIDDKDFLPLSGPQLDFRCVSWSLGRTSVPSMIPLPDVTTQMSSVGDDNELCTDHECAIRGLELHEIGNQIQLAQVQTRNTVASRLGLPRLYQQDKYHTVAIQLDSSLERWENSLRSDWQFRNLQNIADNSVRAKAVLLHARLLGTRIFLYRPMLARYFSMKSSDQASTDIPSLSDRLFKECAGICVETAQKIVSMILDSLEPNVSMGLLPWWYRVYYLHIAGTTFLAAMLSDLFTESVSQSWHSMLTGLREHKHLSFASQLLKRSQSGFLKREILISIKVEI